MKNFCVYDNDFIESEELFALASRSASANGTGVDIADYEGILSIFVHSGNTASGTVDIKIQTSADDSDYTDLAADDGSTGFTQLTTTNTGLRGLNFNSQRAYKYIRAVSTHSASNACTYAVYMLGKKDRTDNA